MSREMTTKALLDYQVKVAKLSGRSEARMEMRAAINLEMMQAASANDAGAVALLARLGRKLNEDLIADVEAIETLSATL